MTHVLVLDSWAGRERIPCEIVGETPKRLRIKVLRACRLPSRRDADAGDVVLVPKYAVREQKEQEAA